MISLHTLTHISSDCSSWALEIRIQFVSRSALVCMCECAIGGGGGGVVGGLHVWMCLCVYYQWMGRIIQPTLHLNSGVAP